MSIPLIKAGNRSSGKEYPLPDISHLPSANTLSLHLELIEDEDTQELSVNFLNQQNPDDDALTIRVNSNTIVTIDLYQPEGSIVNWEFDLQKGFSLGPQADRTHRYQYLSYGYSEAGRRKSASFEAGYRGGNDMYVDHYNMRLLVHMSPSGIQYPAPFELKIDPDIKNPGNIGLGIPSVS